MSPTARRNVGPASRMLNGGCYATSGIVIFALGAHSIGTVLLALAMLGYGGYILLTRRSYWVSSVTYVLPILALALVFLHR